MASETETLVTNCLEAVGNLQHAGDNCKFLLNALMKAAKELDDAAAMEVKDAKKAADAAAVKAKTAITEHLKLIKLSETAASALNKKVLLKTALSLFKTQKSLDMAKKALATANEANKAGATDGKKFAKAYDDGIKQIKNTKPAVTRTL